MFCEAEPYFNFSILPFLILLTAFRFTVSCKVKIKAVKVSIERCHNHTISYFRLQIYNFSTNPANILMEKLHFH